MKNCTENPCQVTTNVADRLIGEVDLRPNQFGTAGVAIHNIPFKPPTGFRTRILRLHGDFTAVFVERNTFQDSWMMRYQASQRSYFAGALTSFRHTGPEGSPHADHVADNAMVYRQRFLHSRSPTGAVDYSEKIINGLLQPDNILRIVHAVFNNTSGKFVQMETTVQIQFRFEPIPPSSGPDPTN